MAAYLTPRDLPGLHRDLPQRYATDAAARVSSTLAEIGPQERDGRSRTPAGRRPSVLSQRRWQLT
ncbi:hypothetical protein AB0919_23290 [Streptomyces sp. NPDC046994]|uniref:hypothetical protein n=1 Tax=Streptomyces sp. NPDC046994 TaxID=3155735 RepID=UPI003451D574